jgi:hypothetical protein
MQQFDQSLRLITMLEERVAVAEGRPLQVSRENLSVEGAEFLVRSLCCLFYFGPVG